MCVDLGPEIRRIHEYEDTHVCIELSKYIVTPLQNSLIKRYSVQFCQQKPTHLMQRMVSLDEEVVSWQPHADDGTVKVKVKPAFQLVFFSLPLSSSLCFHAKPTNPR